MHARCRGNSADGRKYYVANGITVCERWSSFENFLADMGEPPDGMTLDRYPDKDGNYEPTNCRWATDEEQANNKREYAYQGTGSRGPYRVKVRMGDETHFVSREAAQTLLENGWKIVPRNRQSADVSDGPDQEEAA
jgi:hypothetical protein